MLSTGVTAVLLLPVTVFGMNLVTFWLIGSIHFLILTLVLDKLREGMSKFIHCFPQSFRFGFVLTDIPGILNWLKGSKWSYLFFFPYKPTVFFFFIDITYCLTIFVRIYFFISVRSVPCYGRISSFPKCIILL